jgi:hypothetical protein
MSGEQIITNLSSNDINENAANPVVIENPNTFISPDGTARLTPGAEREHLKSLLQVAVQQCLDLKLPLSRKVGQDMDRLLNNLPDDKNVELNFGDVFRFYKYISSQAIQYHGFSQEAQDDNEKGHFDTIYGQLDRIKAALNNIFMASPGIHYNTSNHLENPEHKEVYSVNDIAAINKVLHDMPKLNRLEPYDTDAGPSGIEFFSVASNAICFELFLAVEQQRKINIDHIEDVLELMVENKDMVHRKKQQKQGDLHNILSKDDISDKTLKKFRVAMRDFRFYDNIHGNIHKMIECVTDIEGVIEKHAAYDYKSEQKVKRDFQEFLKENKDSEYQWIGMSSIFNFYKKISGKMVEVSQELLNPELQKNKELLTDTLDDLYGMKRTTDRTEAIFKYHPTIEHDIGKRQRLGKFEYNELHRSLISSFDEATKNISSFELKAIAIELLSAMNSGRVVNQGFITDNKKLLEQKIEAFTNLSTYNSHSTEKQKTISGINVIEIDLGAKKESDEISNKIIAESKNTIACLEILKPLLEPQISSNKKAI